MQRSSPIKRLSLSDKERENNENSNNTDPKQQRRPSTMLHSDASPSHKANTPLTMPTFQSPKQLSSCKTKDIANKLFHKQETEMSTPTGVAAQDGSATDNKDDLFCARLFAFHDKSRRVQRMEVPSLLRSFAC